VIAVALDDRERAARFAKELELGFPVMFDPKLKIAEDYQGRTTAHGIETPYHVLISREGKVVSHFSGARAALDGTLEKAVKELAEKK
jgi:peroxiredoxin